MGFTLSINLRLSDKSVRRLLAELRGEEAKDLEDAQYVKNITNCIEKQFKEQLAEFNAVGQTTEYIKPLFDENGLPLYEVTEPPKDEWIYKD